MGKYNRDELVNKLRNGIVTVKFIKHNGEERVMRCTLQKSYLPENTNNGITQHDDLIAVWDLDKNAWRSFNVSSVLDA